MARKRYLSGLEVAERSFRRMPAGVREQLVDAINRSAKEAVERIRFMAPSEELAEHTKRLPIDESKTGVGVTVQNTDYRARWIEFGTQPKKRVIKKGKRSGVVMNHPGTPPQPFFWPAIRSLRKRIRGRVKRALNAAAKEIARGR